jgi:endoglycosylceramidase
MKKLAMLVVTGLAVAMLTVLTGCEKPVTTAPSSAASPQRLGHAGRWLTDDQGRVVILRGFNMVNKFAPFTLSAAGFGEEDAALLAKDGFNAVRVGVIYSAVEPRPG